VIRRRVLVAAGGTAVLALPFRAGAQQPGRSYRLGWLSPGAGRGEVYNLAFVQRLRELGFVEGRHLVIASAALKAASTGCPNSQPTWRVSAATSSWPQARRRRWWRLSARRARASTTCR